MRTPNISALNDAPTMEQPVDEDSAAMSVASGSAGPLSPHGSIRGPYHIPNTFPQSNNVSSVGGLVETYTRSLLSSGNGYPIWDIPGNLNRPEKHIKQGVNIGDVGILDPEGDFVFVFNIFYPPEDSIHHCVPEGFREFYPALDRKSEIELNAEYFSPGTVVSSRGIHTEILSKTPLDVKLLTTAREGAALILPDGASREDLVPAVRSRLPEYIHHNVLEWYHLICDHAPTEASYVPNGSLYLVTGCDKAKSYALCSIPRSSKDAGKRVEMRYRHERSPQWEDNRPAATKSSTASQEGEDNSHTVFIRGLRISLSDRLWIKELPFIEAGAYYNLLSTPVMGLRSRTVQLKEAILGVSETYLAGKQKVHFHPSIIISQLLLKKMVAADITVIDDSIWCDRVAGRHLTLYNVLSLLSEIMDSCQVTTHGKLVTLVPSAGAILVPPIKSRWPSASIFRFTKKSTSKDVLREIKNIVKPPWYSFVV